VFDVTCSCGATKQLKLVPKKGLDNWRCRSCFQKGRRHSEATKNKIRVANQGQVITAEARQKMSDAHKGVPLGDEHRASMRKAQRRRWGVDAPKDINQADAKRWVRAVKERDKCCQHCGATDDLHAHHIFPRRSHPEQQYNVHNGITLCQTCHFDLHSIINPFNPHDKFNTPYSNEDAA